MATLTYKCLNCGSGLRFSPEENLFVCDYCLSKFTDEDLKKEGYQLLDNTDEAKETSQAGSAEEEKTYWEDSADDFEKHSALFSCPSCGAEVITTDTTAATSCVYCHNPVVLTGRVSGEFKPNKVLPFSIGKDSVNEKFNDWVSKKWFVRSDFYNPKQMENIQGVYFPFWIVDADGNGYLDGEGRRVRVWRAGDIEYTETSVFRVIREGNVHLEDITIKALNKDDAKMLTGIFPFKMESLKDFSMPFLSGFLAEKRNLEKADVYSQAEQEMKNSSDRLLRDTVMGYTSFTGRGNNFQLKKDDWCYALMPVWTLVYKYRNETYYFVMNGQTGKVAGRVPISLGKLSLLFFIVTILVALGMFVLRWNT